MAAVCSGAFLDRSDHVASLPASSCLAACACRPARRSRSHSRFYLSASWRKTTCEIRQSPHSNRWELIVGASDEGLRAALKAHRALGEKGDSPKNDVLAQAVLFHSLV